MKNYLYYLGGRIFKGGVYIFTLLIIKMHNLISDYKIRKILKGGYCVIRDDKKRELSREKLEIGWFTIKFPNAAKIKQSTIAYDIEFFNKDKELQFRTKL